MKNDKMPKEEISAIFFQNLEDEMEFRSISYGKLRSLTGCAIDAKDKRVPGGVTLYRIANALNVSIDVLLGLDDYVTLEKTGFYLITKNGYVCSRCRYPMPIEALEPLYDMQGWAYCPHCGAKNKLGNHRLKRGKKK